MNYYKRHIGDYAAVTRHLSILEHGAYMLLLDTYYSNEAPLPSDIKLASRKIGARSKDEINAVDVVLNEFFHLKDDGWHQSRCDEEIEKYKAKSEINKTVGVKGGRPRKTQTVSENNPQETQTVSENNPNQEPLTTNQEPLTTNQEPIVINPNHGLPALLVEDEIQQPEEKTSIAKQAEPPRFDEFWAEYPKKSGRKAALSAWRTNRLDSRADELIADVRLRSGSDRKWLEGFIPNPATYLNGERWNDEIERANGARASPNKPSAGEITMQNFESVMRRMEVGGAK